MLGFSFLIDGEPVDPSDVGRALSNQFARLLLEQVAEQFAERLEGIHCVEHNARPELTLTYSSDGGSVAVAVGGCCDDLVARARAGIDDSDGSEVGARTSPGGGEARAGAKGADDSSAGEGIKTSEPARIYVAYDDADYSRFVEGFNERLAACGVDAFVERIDVLPGDRFVRRRFEELGAARAFVIVLSKASVDAPWVREDLDTAIVERIERSMVLIPVVLDGCPVPTALRSTKPVKVTDSSNPGPAAAEVARRLFDRPVKSRVSPPPGYTAVVRFGIRGANQTDAHVFGLLYEKATAEHRGGELDADSLLAPAAALGITDVAFYKSLRVLESNGLVVEKGCGCPKRCYTRYKPTDAGFDQYFRNVRDDYVDLEKRAAVEISSRLEVGDSRAEWNSDELMHALGLEGNAGRQLARHFVKDFRRRGWLKCWDSHPESLRFCDVEPELERYAEEG